MNNTSIQNASAKRPFEEAFHDDIDHDVIVVENQNKMQKTGHVNDIGQVINYSYWDILPNELVRVIAVFLTYVKDPGNDELIKKSSRDLRNFDLVCKKNERNTYLAWRELARIKQINVPWDCCAALGTKKDKNEYILSQIFYSYLKLRINKKTLTEKLALAIRYQTMYEEVFNRFPLWGHFFRKDIAQLSNVGHLISKTYHEQIQVAAKKGGGENLLIGFANYLINPTKLNDFEHWTIRAIDCGATIAASWLFNLKFLPQIVERVALAAAKKGDFYMLEYLAKSWDETKLENITKNPEICPPKILFELGLRKKNSNLIQANEYIDKAIVAYKNEVPKEVLVESMIVKTNLNNLKEANSRYIQITDSFSKSSFDTKDIIAFIKNRTDNQDFDAVHMWLKVISNLLFFLDLPTITKLATVAKLMKSPQADLFYYVALANFHANLPLSFLLEGAEIHESLNRLEDTKNFYDQIIKKHELMKLDQVVLEKMLNLYFFFSSWNEIAIMEGVLSKKNLIESLSDEATLNLAIFSIRNKRQINAKVYCHNLLKKYKNAVTHDLLVKIDRIFSDTEPKGWTKAPPYSQPFTTPEALGYISFIKCKQGDFQMASQYLESFKSHSQSGVPEDALVAIGYVLDQLGKVKEADDLFNQVSNKYGEKKMPLDLILYSLNTKIKLKNYSGALPFINNISDKDKKNLSSQQMTQIAQVYYQEMQREKYVEYFELAIQQAPTPIPPNIALPYIQMLISEDNYLNAEKMYKRLVTDRKGFTLDQLFQDLSIRIALSKSSIKDEINQCDKLLSIHKETKQSISIPTLLFMMESLISKEIDNGSPTAKKLYDVIDKQLSENKILLSSYRVFFLVTCINKYFNNSFIAKQQFDVYMTNFNAKVPASPLIIYSRALFALKFDQIHKANEFLESLKLESIPLSDVPKNARSIALAIYIKGLIGQSSSKQCKTLKEILGQAFSKALTFGDEESLIKLLVAQHESNIKCNNFKINDHIDYVIQNRADWSKEFSEFLISLKNHKKKK